MKRISALSSIALAAVLSTAAWAQQPPTRTDQQTVPGMAPGISKPDDAGKPAANVPAPPAPSDSVSVISRQMPGESLASEMKGMTVKNAADEQLGTISDLVMSDDGKLNAVLIRVGGFLGIGAADVAVARDSVKLKTDKDGNKTAILETSREALEKAPRYVTVKGQIDAEKSRQPATPPRSTSAPGGAPSPAPSNRVN